MKKEDPPTPQRGTTKRGTPRTYREDPIAPDTQRILDHLNAKTGRRYRSPNEISAALSRGATAEECLLVIDWWAEVKIRDDPTQDRYFDTETPFRQKHFDKYRAAAEVWDQQGRQHRTADPRAPTRYGDPRYSEKALYNMQATDYLLRKHGVTDDGEERVLDVSHQLRPGR